MATPDPVKAPCIFCRSTQNKLTKEHVWPDWLREIFPETKSSTFYRHPSPTGNVQSWVGPSFDATVRVVCSVCNSTWMSDIEKAAKQLLAPMVRPGEPVVLDAQMQARIAAWAFLRAVILHHTGREEAVIPGSHISELFGKHRPPLQSAVWIAAYNRPFALTSYRAMGGHWDPPASGELYVITLSVGILAFHIFGHTSAQPYERFQGTPRGLFGVWPSTGIVTWPPRDGFDDVGIEQLHTSFTATWTREARAILQKRVADQIRNRRI